MDASLPFYLVAGTAVIILGLSKGGFAGVGMISTPLLALVVGPVTAAGFMLPILVIQDVVAVWMYKRTWNRRIIATMMPGAALGIGLAYGLASTVPEWSVEITLGIISLLFAVQQLIRSMRPTIAEALAPSSILGTVSGLGSGFTSMIAHSGTPPFQFYVMPQKLERDEYIGTSVVFFASLNAMKIPAFAALGQITTAHLATAVVFAPIAVASSWLGVYLVRRVDVRKFNLTITLILACVGVALICQGIAGSRG